MRLSLLVLACSALSSAVAKGIPKGFVTTDGTNFKLDGKKFAFYGSNSYWLPLLTSTSDVDKALSEMKSQGVKVLRTWGFNAINATELAGAKASGLTYYQVWYPNGTYTLNTGAQGLERLDYVVEAAGKYGIKLILTFTNNWVGYGGVDLYVRNILGSQATQDTFFTNPKVIKSYQSYVKALVARYKSSPNVFAWELGNEFRCLGELPAGPNCVPGSNTLYNWYKQQSDYVRTLDPYHLITTGGEGHFYWKSPVHYWYNHAYVSDYNYNGQAGEDFDKDIHLPNIDFGTYHLYPQSWYPELDYPGSNFTVQDWGKGWIIQHAAAAKKAHKPVILEEFGLTGETNKTKYYPIWIKAALDSDHGGIMPWQFGALGLTENGGNRAIKYADAIINGASPNDGYALYSNQTTLWNLFKSAAKVQDSRSN